MDQLLTLYILKQPSFSSDVRTVEAVIKTSPTQRPPVLRHYYWATHNVKYTTVKHLCTKTTCLLFLVLVVVFICVCLYTGFTVHIISYIRTYVPHTVYYMYIPHTMYYTYIPHTMHYMYIHTSHYVLTYIRASHYVLTYIVKQLWTLS